MTPRVKTLWALALSWLGCGGHAATLVDADAGTDLDSELDADAGGGHGDLLLVGARLVGTDPSHEGLARSVLIRDGVIVALGADADRAGAVETRDLTGLWLAPAFVDSHVHLRFWEVAAELSAAGIAGAVDMAAPPDFFVRDWGALEVIGSGPMLTAVGGYPTQSWGRDGYGRECATIADAVAAIDDAHARGARLVKIPLGAGPDLADEVLIGAVAHAHSLGLPVVAHALGDAAAKKAADLGFDALAHTPVERLAEATVAAWSGKVVVTTLAAFGGATTTVENLGRLRAAGARIVYGTDLGNSRVAAIDPREIDLMTSAGMDGQAILASGTSVPAAFWGFDDLGTIAVGKASALLVLAEDPRLDPTTLAAPVEVVHRR